MASISAKNALKCRKYRQKICQNPEYKTKNIERKKRNAEIVKSDEKIQYEKELKRLRHKIENLRKTKKGEWLTAIEVLEAEKTILKDKFWNEVREAGVGEAGKAREASDRMVSLVSYVSSSPEKEQDTVPVWSTKSNYRKALINQEKPTIFQNAKMPNINELFVGIKLNRCKRRNSSLIWK